MTLRRYNFDPLDPIDPYSYPYPPGGPGQTDRDADRYAMYGCISLLTAPVIFIILFCIVSLLFGCTTTKSVSSEITDHRITDMMERIDSLMHVRTAVQQDSTWRQEILRQFQSIREKSDTSHTIVVDTAGRVIKETLIINNVRETTSETERQELQVMSQRLEVMDSTMNMMRQQLKHSDSLLQQKQTVMERPVAKELNWWQNLQMWLGRLVLITLAVLAAWWLLKKKLPWLPFGK